MTNRILVIADDLTGAAEIGGTAAAHGLAARIGCGRMPEGPCDVAIIDTDSRNLMDREAAGRVAKVLAGVDPSQFSLVYKKTDSVLRGPVAAELSACMAALGFSRALLLPQNPSRGRVIENGVYRINGVPLDRTPLATDAEHPRVTADVRRLLNGPDSIQIADGVSHDDLYRRAGGLDARALPAGGVDFFTAILQQRSLAHAPTASFVLPAGSALIVCGSAAASSREFVDRQPHDWISSMPPALFDAAAADAEELRQWAAEIGDRLSAIGRAIVAVRQPPVAARAGHVRSMIAGVVAAVLAAHRPDVLLIEGGATAAAIASNMGWRFFNVAGQAVPGVVALRTVAAPSQLLILKPGSYPWPGGLVHQ